MIDFDIYIEKVRQNYGQECVDNLLGSKISRRSNHSTSSEMDEDDCILEKAAYGIGTFFASAMERVPKEDANRNREVNRDMHKLGQAMSSFDADFNRIERDFDNEMKQLDEELERMDNW